MKHKNPRLLSMVKPTYPIEGRAAPLIGEGKWFIYFGEIPNMPGHCVVADVSNGNIIAGLHTEHFMEFSDDE